MSWRFLIGDGHLGCWLSGAVHVTLKPVEPFVRSYSGLFH
jgi:hypothetical protein